MTFDAPVDLVELLADLRRRGVEVRADDGILKVSGQKGAYTAGVKAQLIQLKPALLRHLARERELQDATYDREERAWAVQYGLALAYAHGYPEHLVRRVEEALRQRPPRAPFSITSNAIVVSLGDGVEARIYNAPRT